MGSEIIGSCLELTNTGITCPWPGGSEVLNAGLLLGALRTDLKYHLWGISKLVNAA